ncbi:hypothetical protein MMC30_009122 [Trapelia coarctata]|nr:hypothetical protein [Trapelia coarctata]
MQLKFLAAALLSVASVTSANNIATISVNPSQSSKIQADASSYFSSLYAQPQWTSVISVLATGLPESEIESITADPANFFVLLATATALPPAYKSLPSDVQSYLSSVGAAEASIVNKDTGNDAAPSGIAMKAAGAFLAAGAVGIALL